MGGEGATGHIPTQSARRKLSKRMSKRVINTETLEILKSGTELLSKYVYTVAYFKKSILNAIG